MFLPSLLFRIYLGETFGNNLINRAIYAVLLPCPSPLRPCRAPFATFWHSLVFVVVRSVRIQAAPTRETTGPKSVNASEYPKIAATCNMRTASYFYLGDTASELLHRFNREKGHNTSRTAKGSTDTFRMPRRQLESLCKPNTYTGICHSRTSIRRVRGYTRWPGKRLWGPR